jgi:hypothetical protein
MNQDFTKRISVVLDKDLESWKLLNTVGHISAFLGNKIGDKFVTGNFFATLDGVEYPRNCQYPIIALSASREQLKEFIKVVKESGLEYVAYIPEMVEYTDDEKLMEKVGAKKDEELEFHGIGIFGDNDRVKELTQQFSLWK